jgi:hypothetical protein
MSTLHALVLMLLPHVQPCIFILGAECGWRSKSPDGDQAGALRTRGLAELVEQHKLRCLPVDWRDMQPPAPSQSGVAGYDMETAVGRHLSGDLQPHAPSEAEP